MATPTKSEGKTRVAPVLGLQEVEEIPPAPPSGASRELHNLLVTVANEYKGRAMQVGVYSSKEGAAQVRRAFNSGKRTPPGGEIDNWTFEARRRTASDGGGSVLYVQYAEDGPDVKSDADES